jgi:hypothetical protein
MDRPTVRPPSDKAWLRLLERAVGGWAPTLRASLLLVALYLSASILLVIAFGFTGLLLAAGLALVLAWVNTTERLPRA